MGGHKLLYKAVLEEQAANLELEVVPFRQTADGEAATSPLVRSLTQTVGAYPFCVSHSRMALEHGAQQLCSKTG